MHNRLARGIVAEFGRSYGRPPSLLVRAPGRVNLLGAHVDYIEGWVLPGAIDRVIWLAVAPRPGPLVTIRAFNFDAQATFSLEEALPDQSAPTWLRYAHGVALALRAAGFEPGGMEALLAGDIPIGAGVSSSAALEMAFVLAWEALSGFALDGLTRARLGQQVENETMGVASGIMDQFATVHGRADHLILLDCRTLAYELLPVPPGTAVLVIDSGVRRELTRVDYNSRPAECRQAAAILGRHLPGVQTLRDVSPEGLASAAHHLPEPLLRRARHAVGECARVLDGADALRRGDIAAFGRLMNASQASSRDNYDNSIPELDLLAAAAQATPGCYGARFGGGGFGGCMQVLAEQAAVPVIEEAVSRAFAGRFGRRPTMFTCTLADGAQAVWLE